MTDDGKAGEGKAGEGAVDVLCRRLDEGLARLGGPAAALDDGTRERLVRFVRLLEKWNRVHNLTAVREAHEMIGRHLLDSLALLPWLPAPEGEAPGTDDAVDLLDIGSGGGLPVIPLAIARPALACLSVEAAGKKVRFQRQAVLELGLPGVEARHARIEDVRTRALVVVSRAFAAPADFLERAAPRCATGGVVLVMLGRRERLPEPLPAPFALEAIEALDIPFDSGVRHVAVCRKP